MHKLEPRQTPPLVQDIHPHHPLIIRSKQLPLILWFHDSMFPLRLHRFDAIERPGTDSVDILASRLACFDVDYLAEEFAEFEVCVEVFGVYAEEGVFAGEGRETGGGGRAGGTVAVFSGDFLDCTVDVIQF